DGHGPIHEAILDLCRGVDLLVHDAQFVATELEVAEAYGHATVDYSYRLAEEAEVGRLVLFHHSPVRVDDDVDRLCDLAPPGLDVTIAREGETLTL
ncbi:MAG: MBL fold metallo-hydrolase, partial [Acidimicrobiales bacterium]